MNQTTLYRVLAYVMFISLLSTIAAFWNTAYAAVNDPTARDTPLLVAITYMNIGVADANVTCYFHAKNNSTVIAFPIVNADGTPLKLKPGASASLVVSTVIGLGDELPFRGSAVMSANSPLATTIVQIPQGQDATEPLVKNRPLSNGFNASQSATRYLIPTVLHQAFNTTTLFSVQNATMTNDADIDIAFIDATGTTVATQHYPTVPAGATVYVAADDPEIGLPDGFNGAAVITASSRIVASVNEMRTDTKYGDISSFEGIPQGAQTLYMPYAMCDAFTGNTTAYAVQNAGVANAHVTVTYVGATDNGNDDTRTITTDEVTIAPGQKASFVGCEGKTNGKLKATFSGAATIKARDGERIVAVGKVTGAGLSTSALGDSTGAAAFALPYVRWTPDPYFVDMAKEQRTYIAVQNITGHSIDAYQIQVTFIDADGVSKGTYSYDQELPDGGKFSINPAKAGALDAKGRFGVAEDAEIGKGPYGGGAIVRCLTPECKLSVIARVESNYWSHISGVKVGEDYNGISIE